MSEHAGGWFTNPEFLKGIGRNSIAHFFAAFAADLHAADVVLPDPKLPDELYYQEAARFLQARQGRLWLSRTSLPVCVPVAPFTLEPFRTLGPDALDPTGIPGICKMTLCEIKVVFSNGHCRTLTSEADDLFQTPDTQSAYHPAIPQAGTLTRATLKIQFADSITPRSVVLCPPQTVQLLQAADAQPVRCWLAGRGFLVSSGYT
jgi:hypothetical protein